MPVARHHELLQRSSDIAQLFKKAIGSSPPVYQHPPIPPPVIAFPLPDYVRAELGDASISEELRKALSATISDVQQQYRHVFEKTYARSLSARLPGMEQFGPLLQQRFATQALPKLMRHHSEAKAALASAVAVENRPTPKFNTAYIPYLKVYFDYNAYPSLHDREMIAKKTMMTSRQIEVWFQNHRRIEKKAGRPCVKRKASDAGPSQSQIDKIEQVMGMFGVSKEERDGTDAEEEKLEYVQGEKGRGFASLSAPRYPPDATATDVLAMPDRPIPAFVPGYTPFLSGAAPAVSFPAPTWARRPATQARAPPAQHPSFSELSEAFATTLRIYSDIARVSDKSVPPAATCAITTRLEPGHHPALKTTPAATEEEEEEEEEASLGLQRQVSWSSASSGSEESLPATPQSTNVDLELEPEPFDDLFDEVPVHDEVPLDIEGFVYADYPAPDITVGGKAKKKKKSHYRT